MVKKNRTTNNIKIKNMLDLDIESISSDLLESAIEMSKINEKYYFLLKKYGEVETEYSPEIFTSKKDLQPYPRILRGDVLRYRILKRILIERSPSWEMKVFYIALYSLCDKISQTIESFLCGSDIKEYDYEDVIMFLKFIKDGNVYLESKENLESLYSKEEIKKVEKEALKLTKEIHGKA